MPLGSRDEIARQAVKEGLFLRSLSPIRVVTLCTYLGSIGLGLGSCAAPSQAPSRAPMETSDSELLALRRENDALRQEIELMRDRGLMCSAQSSVPVKTGSTAVRLAPGQDPAPVERPRPRGVSLRDLPHSAPDPAVMDRYAASAAPELPSTSGVEPKRYRLVGEERSRTQKGIRASRPAVTQKVERSKPARPLNTEAVYARARKLYRRGDRVKARTLFERIEREDPQSDLADNAVYWLAEDDRDAGRLAQAQAGFMRILSDYPGSNKVEDAMYMLALCFKQNEQMGRARSMLQKVAKAGRKELRKKARRELASLGSPRSNDELMNGR